MFLTYDKAAEFNRVISELTNERTRLEELYYKVRSDLVGCRDQLDDALLKAESNKDLVAMRDMAPSELSDKLIAMSGTLHQLRLSTAKAERRASELEERETY